MKKNFLSVNAVLCAIAGIAGLFFSWSYFQRAYAAVGWWEACFLYLSLFLLAGGITYIALGLFKVQDLMRKNILFSVFIFFASILIVEFVLRAFHINRAYIETRGGKYLSSYPKHNTDTLFIIRAEYPKMNTTEEFSYSRISNNMGFRDVEFISKRDSLQLLIQTYGDSFTEGDGAPADSAYPAILRRLMSNDNITIQNFGIMGSDPAFYWMQMKEIGAKLQPDIAVITYCTFDLTTDFFTRGGLERFKNGYYSGFEPPKWEWLYGYSYLFRLFSNSLFSVSYNNFFLTETQKQQRLKSLEQKWNETFTAIAGIAQKNNIRVLLIKKPERSELDLNKYNYDFNFFERMADTMPVFKRYDLLPFYRDSLHICRNNSIKYYWPKDGHHNSKGYEVMAKAVRNALRKNYKP